MNLSFQDRTKEELWLNTPWESLVETLQRHACEQPDYTLFRFLINGEEEGDWLTAVQLDRQARSIAAWLQQHNMAGERVLLSYPPGLDFIRGFMGCLYAGAIAVPIYPPHKHRGDERLSLIARDAQPRAVLCVESSHARLVEFLGSDDIDVVATDSLPDMSDEWQVHRPLRADTAFLQYTSGSTSQPKGVMVSHENIVHNAWYLTRVSHYNTDMIHITWQPFFHDMGLVGSVLFPIYSCSPVIVMAPAAFLQKPIRWLRAIHRYRGTSAPTPNFGVALCVSDTTPEEREGLDLSCLRVLWNGAEPIRASTIHDFTETFAPYGFDHNAHLPCYGMAETTLCVSGSPPELRPLFQQFSTEALEQGRVELCEESDRPTIELVGCGHIGGQMNVLIVNPETRRACTSNEIGEIWITGPSVAQGYWRQPEQTKELFDARLADDDGSSYLRTGDLGFILNEELFVTGRLKDMLIIRGRNVYPHDVERVVDASDTALQPDSCVVFPVESNGQEMLCVAAEVKRAERKRVDANETLARIRSAVVEQFELPVYWIGLVQPFSIPKTSSGKLMRLATKDLFENEKLKLLGEWRAVTIDKAPAEDTPEWNALLRKASPAEQRRQIITYLRETVSKALNLNDLPDPSLGFAQIGVDSMMAVEISKRLETWLGRNVELSSTLLFDQHSIEAVAEHLCGEHLAPEPDTAEQIQPAPAVMNEPIAIVGMACRFPSAPDTAAYWELLEQGRDAICPVPADRWDRDAFYDADLMAPGTMYTREGGFVEGYDGFDARFFDLSPREVMAMDPQQRITLETAWTALEDAGIAPSALSGTHTGVFFGVCTNDYLHMLLAQGAKRDESMIATGSAASGVPGRLSFLLGLRGPSMAIDSACSSSLVAVHHAMRSLRLGECETALAGGVNLILDPDVNVLFCKAGMLSMDSRCKVFDESADGYSRGEGCGVVVLKRLSAARRDGDRIHAVIRGSAMNHDGHSSGLTVPSGPAQSAVIEAALRDAGVAPADVQVLEMHGTGTPLGDPIEVQAADTVYARGRDSGAPLLIGSAKSNLGHLEAAAGMAGLIKMVLALQNQRVPRTMHFKKANPHIRWDQHLVHVVAETMPWPDPPANSVPRAGVSSFGFMGTNAHLIVEAPSDPQDDVEVQTNAPEHHVLSVSARSETAMQKLCAAYADWIEEHSDIPIESICHTANVGRNVFEHRAVMVSGKPDEFCEQLRAVAQGKRTAGASVGEASRGGRRVAFLFTGQGAQYAGMGRELYNTEPVFRAAIDRCADVYRELLGSRADTEPSLQELLFDPDGDERFKNTLYIQPAVYALQVALAAVWRSWGIEPVALLGHSLGEFAAAAVDGVFSEQDGLRLVMKRAQLMQELPSGGAMASVTAPPEDVEAALEDEPHVCISAYNGLNTVISGPAENLDALLTKFQEQEVYCQRLPATSAFHSMFVDPMLDDYETFMNQLEFGEAKGSLVSGLTGTFVEAGAVLGSDHWRAHAREPVRFMQGVKALFEERDCDIVLEIGPKAELMWLAQMCWRPEHEVIWTSSLEQNQHAHNRMLSAAGELHAAGANIDFAGMEKAHGIPVRNVGLPTYPFEHERFWPERTMKPTALGSAQNVFKIAWQPQVIAEDAGPVASRTWLLLGGSETLRSALADRLTATGQSVAHAEDDTASGDIVAEHIVMLCDTELGTNSSALAVQEAQKHGVEAALLLVQRLSQSGRGSRVWFVTRGAQPVIDSDRVDPTHWPLWGFAKTYGLEHPDRFGGIIDVAEDEAPDAQAGTLCRALLTTDAGTQLAIRNGEGWVPRLLEVDQSLSDAQTPVTVKPDATYLITGGTGALGAEVALHLAGRGATRVVLSSRRGRTDDGSMDPLEERLTALGCELEVYQADVAIAGDVDRLLGTIASNNPDKPLRGIVHAAGTLDGAPVLDQSLDLLRSVMAAKVAGGWNVFQAIQQQKLDVDFLVLFSSAASIMGLRGHSNYSAANAFLDGLAHHGRQQGQPVVSINWGPWAQHGMATLVDASEWEAMGSRLMAPETAMKAFDRVSAGEHAQICVQTFNSERWYELSDAGMLPPVMETFMQSVIAAGEQLSGRSHDEPVSSLADGALVVRLRELDAAARTTELEAVLLDLVGQVLGMKLDAVNTESGFFDIGMNSIMAVELSRKIQASLGGALKIQPADIFNHPTVAKLMDHLLSQLFGDDTTLSLSSDSPIMEVSDFEDLAGGELSAAFDHALSYSSGPEDDKTQIGGVDESRMRAALQAIARLEGQVAQLSTRAEDPIAIVGMACRVPGAENANAFWQVLDQGFDMISEVPPSRWDLAELYDSDPDAPGKISTRWGGFLKDVEQFDADFFGISPREAKSMDPQHRILLEVAWHALENANLAPDRLSNTSGAVYLGITAADYSRRVSNQNLEDLDAYVGTGNALSAAAGRLAFKLGWTGPALAIDTACSSSLVAVHEACASLRRGECDHALAGGVNILLNPEVMVALSRAHMLSPDGRCKTFDAAANGFVRSEGCGMVVLKRLSDAQRDGDQVHALIHGSAINQDGSSSGLTVPNGIAQEQVIRSALAMADLQPAQIQYLECHGTGTSLGDPIEVQAADAVYGQDRDPNSPLMIGSAKTNVGHLESAAGIIGVIKSVLAIQHERIPQSLHFENPNPHIPWEDLKVQVVNEAVEWPDSQGSRLAAVSSFGFVGTNAHIVLGSAPSVATKKDGESPIPERSRQTLTLSARTEIALRALGKSYLERFTDHEDIPPLGDICHTANTGRSHFEHRAGLVFGTHEELQAQLAALSEGNTIPGLCTGTIGRKPKIAFLCTGQGSQYVGMGKELYETEAVFRELMDRCASAFEALRDESRPFSLLQVMGIEAAPENMDHELLNQTGYTQPSLYALEVSLAGLWRSWGLEPSATLGHSVGEYVAAVIAGVFDLETGMALIAERSRLMQSVPAGGAMAAITGPVEQIEAAVTAQDTVCIGAYNGANTVISGPEGAVEEMMEQLNAAGLKCKRLKTSHAFHSAQMDGILEDFERFASEHTFSKPIIRLISNVSGEVVDQAPAAAYWARHIRQPVRFAPGLQTAKELGCDVMLELGPHPVLVGMGQHCWDTEEESEATWVGSLRRGEEDTEQVLRAVAQLYAAGVDVDFDAMDKPWKAQRRKVSLPLYPFQRQRHWVEEPQGVGSIGEPKLDDCLYRMIWEEKPVGPGTSVDTGAERWAVVADETGLAGSLGEVFEKAGVRCEVLDTSAPDSIAAVLDEITHIVHLRSLDVCRAESLEQLEQAQRCGVESVLELSQILIRKEWQGKLWLVTRGTQQVLADEKVEAAQCPVWGMGKALGMERPALWGGLVDLPLDEDPVNTSESLARVLLAGDDEECVALRGDKRWTLRLQPQPLENGKQSLPVKEDAAYLITGGLGGVGLATAQRLVDRGARHLVLTSRKPPQEAAQAKIDALTERGCHVEVIAADVSQEADVKRLLDAVTALDQPPLRGIIHAAGVEMIAPLDSLDVDQLRHTLAAKVSGGWLLDDHTRDMELDFFICTSSIASVWGSVMQGAYAAANAFLDGLVAQRRSAGRVAAAVNYGPWAEVGMGTSNAEGLKWLRSRGIQPLAPAFAVDAMETVAAAGLTQATCVNVNWSVFRELTEAQRPRTIFTYLGNAQKDHPDTEQQELELVRELKEADAKERLDILKSVIRRDLSTVLGRPESELLDDAGFFDLGMDSLMAVELRNRLSKQLARKMAVPVIYENDSINKLIAFLSALINEGLSSTDTSLNGERPAFRTVEPPSAVNTEPGSPYSLRRYRPEDKDAILALTHDVWGKEVAGNMASIWNWKYDRNPFNVDGIPFILVVEHEERIVATQCGMAGRLKLGSDVHPLQWGVETQIHPQHKAAGGHLARGLETETTDIFLGIPNAVLYAVLERTGEVEPVVTFVNYSSIVHLAPVLKWRGINPVAAGLFGACFRPVAALLRWCRPAPNDRAVRLTKIDSFGAEFDTLWADVAPDYEAICVRDAAFLNWRFSQCPGRDYTIYAAHRAQELAGYVVVHDQERDGVQVGIIIDLLTRRDDRESMGVLITGALRELESRGVDRIRCYVPSHLDVLGRELKRHGLYLRLKVPGGVLNQCGPMQDAVQAVQDWFVTFADSDVDVV